MKKITHWQQFFSNEKQQSYFEKLQQEIADRKTLGHTVFPNENDVFNAFELAELEDIKVVILGQDPYHGLGQAHGLSFSVQRGQKIPPSLRNMFKELSLEYSEFKTPEHGDLTGWAQQGVMLLNAILTVEEKSPGSHQKLGWQHFTDSAIRTISENREHVVFMLWGAFAQKKQSLIDGSKHCILTAPHPSPFSAHKGFFGCDHFRQANEYLKQKGKPSIDWACL
jgi:uracil-DNA glycosylase